MHEPSSRPFSRRERNVVDRKTASVEAPVPRLQSRASKVLNFTTQSVSQLVLSRRQAAIEMQWLRCSLSRALPAKADLRILGASGRGIAPHTTTYHLARE